MQKENTDIRRKILPHHVFQLQCVVDSFTASRGWTYSPLHGHVLVPPPHGFCSRRDVDLFLDRKHQRQGQGLLPSIEILERQFQIDACLHQDSARHTAHSELLEKFKLEFDNWLGMSKGEGVLTFMPSSQFSKHDPNWLWEYSPLLCAAGLVEGLVLVQRVMMKLWECMPEPALIFHLHNNLVQKGYLQESVLLWTKLQTVFRNPVSTKVIPTDSFIETLTGRVKRWQFEQSPLRQPQAASKAKTKDVRQRLDPGPNRFFYLKSTLMMYDDAAWIPERIPDSAVKLGSALYKLRLIQTERVIDPTTNKKSLKETELVKRLKALGLTDDDLLEEALNKRLVPTDHTDHAKEIIRAGGIPELKDYQPAPKRDAYEVSKDKNPEQTKGSELLEYIRADMFTDVCGKDHISSLNLVTATCHMMILFTRIEALFREARHPLWVKAYGRPSIHRGRQRMVALVETAIENKDDKAMELFAQAFEERRVGTLSCVFWEELYPEDSGFKKESENDGNMPQDQCSVM
jgi:hypothetical protein